MTVAVLAGLSLSEHTKTLGALAGFAAVLGLAVLTALFVAQARELKRLRDWAGAAPERALEERHAQQAAAEAQRRAAYQPRLQTPQTPPGAAPATQAAQPAAPAPAATAVAVARKAATVAREAAKAVVPGAPATEEKPEGAGAGEAGAATQEKPGDDDPSAGGGAGTGGAATGTGTEPAAHAPGATANGTVKGDAATAVAKSAAPGAPQTAPGAPQTAAAGGEPPPLLTTSGRKRHNPLAVFGGAAAAVVVLIFLGTRLFGGGDGSSPASTPVTPQPATRVPSGPAGGALTPTARKRVIVAVLNGTTTTGLAAVVADKLRGRGYQIGQITNATDQSRSASAIAYAPGYRRAALDVAHTMHASVGAVRAMDAATRVVAGEDAMVVVTVGSDQSA